MYKLPTRSLVIILTFVIGIFAASGWLYYQEAQKVHFILPQARWELIYFKNINQATNLGGLTELRKTNLRKDDIEIRVWYGAYVSEGVILKRLGGQWSGLHIKADESTETKEVQLTELKPPKSGWDSFWKQITDKGILTIHSPSVEECEISLVDGISYVVEINQNKTYLTYKYPIGGNCYEAKRMEEIGNIIGEEFDSGNEECKRAEWFACTKARKSDE